MDADGTELECRVCRSGAEDERPLYFPCMCSGSIGAVHQDCLEAWLEHSKKDTCELCYTKYEFRPHYLEGTPEVLPVDVVTKSVLKIALEQISPLVLRIVFAVLVWATIVPVLTTCIYCVCVGRSSILSLQFTWPVLKSHIVHGINTDALIALSLLILVSFTDFLRFHIVPVPPDQEPGIHNPVEVQGPAVPAAAPVPAANPAPVVAPNEVGDQVHRRQAAPAGQHEAAHRVELPPLAAALVAAAATEEQSPAEQTAMRSFQQAVREVNASNTHEDWDNLTNHAVDDAHEGDHLDVPQTPAQGAYYSRRDNPQFTETASGRTQGGGVQSGSWEGDNMNRRRAQAAQIGTGDDNPRDSSSSDSSSDRSGSSDALAMGPASVDGDEFWREQLDVEDILQDLDAAGGRVNPVPNEHQQQQQRQQQQEEGGIGAAPAPMAADGGLFGNLNDLPGDLLDDPDFPQDGAEAGAGEIRLAIFELLGVEGPFHLMFRNSFWLLGFCSLYLFFSVMLPYVMGKMLCQLVFAQNALVAYLVPAKVQTFTARIQHYSDNSVPMQFLDFFYVSGGFAGIFCAVFLVDCFASALLTLKKLPNYLKVVLELIGKLSMVIKVGSLLLVRIFLLPLALGTAMIALAAPLVLPYSLEDWARFVALHSLGAFALAWVAGITFMLTMTVTVLQLREVLHPAVFAKLIRPQEPHVELIQSLIVEPGHVHVRRVFISLAVYAVLMVLFILVPLVQLVLSCRALGVSPHFQFKHWYVVPEVQIPLELFVVHVCFLSVLDTRKDVIGRLQHAILLLLTDQLGLKMMLLPHATQPDGTVGAPLRRPPPGWDLRQPNQSTRWAWGTEEPSELERNVYPRSMPADWLPRIVALVLICWALVNALTVYLLCVPIPLARKVLSLLHYPETFQHDPLNFAVGLTLSASLVNGVCRRVPRADRWTAIWQSFLVMPISTLQYVLLLGGYLLVAYTCFGILLRALSVPCDIRTVYAVTKAGLANGTIAWDGFSARSISGFLGNALFTGLVSAQMMRSVLTNNAILAYLQQAADVEGVNNSVGTEAGAVANATKSSTAYRFVRFLEQLKVLAIDVRLALNNGTYNTRALRLREIEQQLVRPFLREVLFKGVMLAALLAAGWSLVTFGTVKSSPEALFCGFQCATYLYALRCAFCLCYYPLRSSQQALHRKILDDNYLVGRTLVNNAQARR